MSTQRNGPDPGAPLEAVFRAEQPALRLRLRRMTGDPETADDLCQEAFLRAWSRAPRDAPAAVLVAWLRPDRDEPRARRTAPAGATAGCGARQARERS